MTGWPPRAPSQGSRLGAGSLVGTPSLLLGPGSLRVAHTCTGHACTGTSLNRYQHHQVPVSLQVLQYQYPGQSPACRPNTQHPCPAICSHYTPYTQRMLRVSTPECLKVPPPHIAHTQIATATPPVQVALITVLAATSPTPGRLDNKVGACGGAGSCLPSR